MPKLSKPFANIVCCTPNMLDVIEDAARLCYLSEPKVAKAAYGNEHPLERLQEQETFLRSKIALGHLSVLEHGNITVDFGFDRGVSHEEVRHRLQAISQSSTRYCNFSHQKFGGEISVIEPFFFPKGENLANHEMPWFQQISYEDGTSSSTDTIDIEFSPWLGEGLNKFDLWFMAMQYAEFFYMRLTDLGATPSEARSVLPNSLETFMRSTMNVREWKWVFRLRAVGESGAPHPQMLEVMLPLLREFYTRWPILFEQEYLLCQEKGRFEWWDQNCKP